MQRRDALKRTALILGSAVAIPSLTSALKGCTPAEVNTYSPVFLNQQQFYTVAAIADRILPATETTGAIDVGVDRFIDLMLNECYAEVEQQRFLQGIAEFQKALGEGVEFQELEKEEKDRILDPISESELDLDINVMFATIKDLTLLGYFTSEQGIKQNYNYQPVPGRYEGCVTLSGDEKPWRGGRL